MSQRMDQAAFEAIEIPEELELAVSRGLRRGKRRRALRHWSSGLTAAVLLLFFTANVPLLRAGAAELPLLGPLVRIMQVGSGGQEAAGLEVQVLPEADGVRLAFQTGEETAGVPRYSVARREAPRRVVLRLHGVDGSGELNRALEGREAVTEVRSLSVTDPEEQGVAFGLRPGWDCAVSQYGDSLRIAFFEGGTPETERYVLCSPPMAPGEELAELTESLLWEGATQLWDGPETVRVVLGEFFRLEQAERAREGLAVAKGADLAIAQVTEGSLRELH